MFHWINDHKLYYLVPQNHWEALVIYTNKLCIMFFRACGIKVACCVLFKGLMVMLPFKRSGWPYRHNYRYYGCVFYSTCVYKHKHNLLTGQELKWQHHLAPDFLGEVHILCWHHTVHHFLKASSWLVQKKNEGKSALLLCIK